MTCCIVWKRTSLLLYIIPFIHPFFFLSNQIFWSPISRLQWELESSNFVYTLRVAKYVVGKKNKMLRFIFALFFHFIFLFSISHSNVIHREICIKDFSGTTVPRILKFDTNVGYNLFIVWKRISLLLLIIIPFHKKWQVIMLYPPIHLSVRQRFVLGSNFSIFDRFSSNFA